MQTGWMCAPLSLSYTDCSEVDEAPSPDVWLGQHSRGTEPRTSLDPGWLHLESDTSRWCLMKWQIWSAAKICEAQEYPSVCCTAVGLLSLGAAMDQPEQVLCVSGMLAWSKTCFKKHSWQCKNRNSFSVSSFDCFGVYVFGNERLCILAGCTSLQVTWCSIWDEPQQRLYILNGGSFQLQFKSATQ